MAGEKAYPTHPDGALDLGDVRDKRPPKPCAKRLASHLVAWCTLPADHTGKCGGGSYSERPEPNAFDKGRRR